MRKYIPPMLKFSVLLVLLFTVSLELKAFEPEKIIFQAGQSQQQISGVVKDEQGAAVPYASVALYRQQDNSMVTGTTTDDAGRFRISADPGKYKLVVSFLSYQPKTIPNLVVEGNSIQLGTISLVSDAVELQEVEVTGEKDQVQLALDKRIFNVSESMARIGGSASDILDNIPSVTVDVDGNVALRGSESVQVLIDGKPSGLVGISSTDALRSLPADMIERVEVITNPSARYQAEGVAGIINIILKKERRDGINLAVNANTGYPHNHGASVNFNYRKRWYNFFVNYGIRYNDFTRRGSTNQRFDLSDTTYFTDITRTGNREDLSNNIRFGSDFFLNEKNTLTAAFLYRVSDEESEEVVNYYDFNENRELVNSSIRRSTETESDKNMEAELNYRRTFEKKGQLLTGTLQYRRGKELEGGDIHEYPVFGGEEGNNILQRTSTDEEDRNFLFQLDYTNPFGEEGVWEAGLRSTSRRIGNDYQVFHNQGGQWNLLDSLSNNFIYFEDVHAAYAIVGDRPGKISYQLGLRAEYSAINTELKDTGETNPRDYMSFFPTAHFTYHLTESNAVEWSYSRRIRRPGQRWLNPFIQLSDNRNIRTGNPNLNPEFTNSIDVGYLHHFNKFSLNSSVYYRHTKDVMQRVTTVVPTDSVQIQFTRPMNLATENSYGFEFVLNADITSWWKTNTNFNFYRQIINGDNIEESSISGLNSDTYTWNARTNMQFNLAKGLNGQMTMFYRAPQERPQGRSRSLFVTDLGLSQEVLDRKGNVSLRVSDLFNTRKWRSITYGENFYSEGEFQWRPRTITLGFTYQLRRENKKGQRPGGREPGMEGGGEEMDF